MISIPLWLTENQTCSYLPGQISQSVVVQPSTKLNKEIYSQLINVGFRRSGNHVYKPHCSQCSACIPTRIAVTDFLPNRAQKRCLQRNAETTALIQDKQFRPQHFDLYQRYQSARHVKDDQDHHSAEDYWQFLGSQWCETLFVEFHRDQHLLGVAVVDQLANGLSAVYTFYEPEQASLSIGVYAVLWQIAYAKQLGLDYVYLGFWVEDCRKMRYKIQYQPLQGLIGEQWHTLPLIR